MYNRYIPNGTSYTRIPMPDGASPPPEPPADRPSPEKPGGLGALGSLLNQNPLGQFLRKNGEGGVLGGLLKALHLEELDTGDILLLLILLFLFLEGDNTELVITLGLILLLGLGDGGEDHPA